MEREPAFLKNALKEDYLFHLSGDDPAAVEEFLKRHPREREALETFGSLHDTVRRELEAWCRRRSEDGLPAPARPEGADSLRIPGYQISREIGRGGMGVVFRARDLETGEEVAVKVFYVSSSLTLRSRFLREAEIISRLESPQIVSIRKSGAESRFLYYVMELLEGETFAERIRSWQGGSSAARFQEVAEIGLSMCSALEVMHSRGIIHRDLKPSNVFLTKTGGVKLLDFGLARDLAASTLTGSGEIVGTLAYMSPEQILGERRRIDRRSDIFGLGASLYEAITLKRPFEEDGESPHFPRILNCDPDPPREVAPEVPADLSAIVQRAMEFEPGMRYATAGDLAMELQRFLAGEQVLARPVTTLGRIHRRLRRKKRFLAPFLGFLAATLTAAILLGTWSAGAAKDRLVETALGEARARAGETRALRTRLEAERRTLLELEQKSSGLAIYDERGPLLEARAEVARLESDARADFDAALLAAQRGLEVAPGNGLLLEFLEDHLWRRYLEVESIEEKAEMKRLEGLILSYVPHLRERLSPLGSLSIRSDPPDAEVYLFRYQQSGLLLRPLPHHPRLGRLLEIEGLPPFALEVVREPYLLLAERGLRVGDRILSVSGFPVGPTGNRVLTKVDHLYDPDCKLVVERGSSLLRFGPGVWLSDNGDACFGTKLADWALNECTKLDPFPLIFLEEGRLGPTPLEISDLEAGSYLCVLRHPGRRDTRVPFTVKRGESVELKVPMFAADQIPEGFVHIPGGPARLGGDPGGFYPEPERRVHLDDFFISRHEVGFRQYFDFLNDPATRAEIEQPGGSVARRLLPVELKEGKVIPAYQREKDGRLAPTNKDWAAWGARFVSKVAAERYALWLTEKEREAGGRWIFALPSADEFEKAARGADGRFFPWGSTFDWSLTSSNISNATQSDRLKPFSTDCSPYDVRDLAGNLAEWTRTLELPPGADITIMSPDGFDYRVKGGSGFDDLEPFFHLGGHTRERAREANYRIGFRLVAYPSSGASKDHGPSLSAQANQSMSSRSTRE